MGAIIIILAKYDGHPQPNWSHISLNSVISWLSTLAKACVLYAVCQSLGQLKWIWFSQRSRPLSDLGCFDSASRGVLGSALLVWLLKGRHFAVFGGMAIILALAFEPFVQNLVHYVSRPVTDDSQTSLLGRAVTYNTVGPLMGGDLFYIDPVMKANIYSSLMNQDSTRPWATPQYTCPTGNCTWDAMPSLGFEAQCTDITSHLDRNCTSLGQDSSDNTTTLYNCTMSLSSGLSLWYIANGGNARLSTMSTFSGNAALQYKETAFPVIEYILAAGANAGGNGGGGISTTFNETSPFTATECALVPIVQLFNASVSLSVYQENQIANWTATNGTGFDGAAITPVSSLNTGNISKELNQTFGVSWEVWDATEVFITSLFAGEVRAFSDSFQFAPSSGSTGIYATADTIEAIFYGNFTAAGCTADDPLTCAMDNVAAAMTKTLRDNAFTNKVGYDGKEVVHAQPAVGRTKVMVLFIEIRWAWIALPVVVWLLGAVSCVGTAWKSYRAETRVWMTSALPLVLLEKRWQDTHANRVEDEVEMTGLRDSALDHDPQTHADDGEDLSLEQYEHRARQVHAKLEIGKGGFALAQ
ncbi:hypothetical protein BO78DRAFT_310695 [Aspergillus sclerotiicarbonarius CBS 121057]|uniref:Uncharacterized protein n=1 Tax=Aspergillus sclerotiicarbonarius (strain CBS 121057 / IBT 28362) TaxID=1448318 RepID=A0A319EDR4_ASPSB|nr:hypothetical protein BO78DRAFT_310695 [Aspergillus sclerotiicarbonarius CBS 121057]